MKGWTGGAVFESVQSEYVTANQRHRISDEHLSISKPLACRAEGEGERAEPRRFKAIK
jgi:hypothetical protein